MEQYNEKLICIRRDTDTELKELQSQGYHIAQISADSIYCWVLMVKYQPDCCCKDIPNQITAQL